MPAPEERILYSEPASDGRTQYWRMPTIWAAAEGKPLTAVAIEALGILDTVAWFGGPNNILPTVRNIAEHARDILNADLSYPIIMTRAGDVLDGAHRIAKASMEGVHTLPAVVLDEWPPPDGVIESHNGRAQPLRK
jgi:hypothetical protein